MTEEELALRELLIRGTTEAAIAARREAQLEANALANQIYLLLKQIAPLNERLAQMQVFYLSSPVRVATPLPKEFFSKWGVLGMVDR